ncbi:MAG: IS6 family transposase [Vulcanimicrobiaceae bacterium]
MSTVKSVIQRLRFPLEVMLVCVRWYVAYPLSLRHLEEMMQERGVTVDHSTIHRWIIKLVPVVEKTFRRRKVGVGTRWRMDETSINVGGHWKYLYRAVDKAGHTVDFLPTAKRDRAAAQRFLPRAIGNNGLPESITIDKSGTNTAGIESYNAEHDTMIAIRQCKYLNNIVEQDHRAVKRIVRPMLGFKSFYCARVIIAGIELMHMIRKGQMRSNDGSALSATQQFYSLAAG